MRLALGLRLGSRFLVSFAFRLLFSAPGRPAVFRPAVAMPACMELDKGVLERFGWPALATQRNAQFVLASRQIGLCRVKELVRVTQQVSDVGFKSLLQVEELVAGLAVLPPQAGILELAYGTGDAIQARQRRVYSA